MYRRNERLVRLPSLKKLSLSFVFWVSSSSPCRAFVVVKRTVAPQKPPESSRLHALIPEENPYSNPDARSLAGVRYSSVLSGLNQIYPPQELDQRNALSRTDGYWPYIQQGKDPPKQLTYGEFDFYFFAQLLDRAHAHFIDGSDGRMPQNGWANHVFVDIGSGTGRLVLAAAGLHPNLRVCRGIELLPAIHKAAEENLQKCRSSESPSYALTAIDDVGREIKLPLAPVEFICGSLEDPYVYFGDASCIFVFSSCMSEELLASLAQSIGRQCKPGTVVITTEFMLPLEGEIAPVEDDERVPSGSFKLDLVQKIDGWCWLTGGDSTAFIHKVTESLWEEGRGPLQPPEISLEDKAYQVATDLESGELADSEGFIRGVYNNMAFHDIPESFRPNLGES